MDFLQPTSLDEALAIKAQRPDAVLVAGGTDVMVDLNFDRIRPEAIIDVTRIDELEGVTFRDGAVRLGARVSYTHVVEELADRLPGLATAARTVGSPQIRNRGTIAGNLATASPAGDCHPVLLACRAEIEAASLRGGTRRIPVEEFFVGPRRHALRDDEMIVATWLPVATGPQQFAKLGRRNGMVTAVAAFAIAIDRDRRQVGTGIGSAGPTPLRAAEAEEFLAGVLEEHGAWHADSPLPESALARFGELVAAAARPIDDLRGSAAYRRHALGVLARRTLSWTSNGGVA